jgi:hypothetical protein
VFTQGDAVLFPMFFGVTGDELGTGTGIGVEEYEEPSSRVRRSDVARSTSGAAAPARYDGQRSERVWKRGPHDLAAPVTRVVIDHDHLASPKLDARLHLEGGEGQAQAWRLVAHGNDDRDVRSHRARHSETREA